MQDGINTIARHHTVVDTPDAQPLTVTRGEIRFEQVSFAYGGFLGDDLLDIAGDADEAIAQARAQDSEGDVAADERARRLEPTLIGHDLPAGSEPPG